MATKSKSAVKPSSASSGGTSFTSFGGQIGGIISLADTLIKRADEVYLSKNCFTAEVYSRAVNDYGKGIELYKNAIMPDVPADKRKVIEEKKLKALANGYGLFNKMVKECGVVDPSIEELLRRDIASEKKEMSYVDQFKRKATDADENRRKWRQSILDLFKYDPCNYPAFDGLAGGQDYEQRFQLEANPLIYRNASGGGRLINIVFLYGPPGTGKTQIAQSVAGFLAKQNLPPVFVQVTASSIKGPFVSESESKLAFLFEELRNEAAKGRAVVCFFDEVDGLVGEGPNGQRDTSLISVFKNQADDSTASAEVNSRILIIAATNNPYLIPNDFFSRISSQYFIGLPGLKETRFVVNRQLKSLGWESINLVDLRTTFRDAKGQLLPDVKSEDLLSLRSQRWEEERKDDLPMTWDQAYKSNANDAVSKLSRFLVLLMVLPADAMTLKALGEAVLSSTEVKALYSNAKIAYGLTEDEFTGTFKPENINAATLGANNKPELLNKLTQLINGTNLAIVSFALDFFEYNWDSAETFKAQFTEAFPGSGQDTIDLFRESLSFLGSSMDAVDIMSLRFRSQFFSIREIGIVFTNMIKMALDKSAGFRSFEVDSSKLHYSKWIFSRKMSSNRIYTANGCKEEKFAVNKLIPLNRSTFKDMEDRTKNKNLAPNVKNLGEDALKEYDKLEKQFLDATDQYTPKEKNPPREGVSERYGLAFGFKFDGKKMMTRVSCKVSTDPDMPQEKFNKLIVTQRYTNNRKTVRTEIVSGKATADVMTKTVREFKLPADSKKWEKATQDAFAQARIKVGELNEKAKNGEDVSSIINQIIGIMDMAYPTKPIIQNTDGMLVDTNNLVDLLAPCQITFGDFDDSYSQIRPKLTYNAQEIITWVGGADKLVTLQKPYFPGTLPSSVQDLIIAASQGK